VETLRGETAGFTTSDVLLGTPAVVAALRQVFNQIDTKLLR